MAVSTALDAVRLGSSEVAALYLGSDSVWTANAPGMVLLTDYTITHAGTSATLTNGQVTFTAVTSLSLNGVFSAGFDNYVISIRHVGSSYDGVRMRLRAAGSDASGSDYTRQELQANGSSVSANRLGSLNIAPTFSTSSTQRSGTTVMMYGPALAQPTASRTIEALGESGGYIYDIAWTHSLSTAYDGVTIFPASANITGALQVYGVRS